jgi:hypothetical protein
VANVQLPQCERWVGDEGGLALLVAVGGRGEERMGARDQAAVALSTSSAAQYKQLEQNKKDPKQRTV